MKNVLISKGSRGTLTDTDLKASWRRDGILDLEKGSLGLLLSVKQAIELMKFIDLTCYEDPPTKRKMFNRKDLQAAFDAGLNNYPSFKKWLEDYMELDNQ